jgi:hypothetical protein
MLIRIKKKYGWVHTTAVWLVAALLVAACAPILSAQTSLQARLTLRPITRDDLAAYGLPSTMELSGGLSTVGVGQPAHLEADVDIAVAASQIAGVTWTLTSKPANSNAVLQDSPLGNDVPVYEPSDRLIYQVAGRKLLRPDVAGIYNISATITTVGSGVATVTTMVTAGTYMGISTCSLCHSNGPAGTTWSKVNDWSKTLHAEIFKDNINGADGTTYATSCWGCHTVGYDLSATVPNGGFNFVQTQLGWTPPAIMQPGNWDAVPQALQNVANIQCENCHGPGSMHASNGGDPRLISVNTTSGVCDQCHSAATHHIKGMEWGNSLHAVTTRDPSGTGRDACVGCHTNNGFIDRINGVGPADVSYGAISCQTCHEPHGETTPDTSAHQLRTTAAVTLADGTKVTTAGMGAICMNCHQARQNAATYAATTAGSAHFGPHEGPQADMLEGTNGYTYGQDIPSSAHADIAQDTCVTCHAQTPAATDPALGQIGGHTFKMAFAGTDKIPAEEMVGACQTCHGKDVTTFNFPLMDYDNDGVIDGAQTEVQHLLDKLALMLPPVGQAKTSLNIDSTWTQPQLEAAYNYLFVQKDGSLGVHNMAYTVGLLKASIADLTANSK